MNGRVHFRIADLEAIVQSMKADGFDIACISYLDPDPDDDYTGGLLFEAVNSAKQSIIYDCGSLDDDPSLSPRFSFGSNTTI